jgi:PDZ domain-containing protein
VVVGPSAGLAFSLYLVDSLTPADLLRGRHVVVSGAVAPDGSVLAVGRMRQKAISAQTANRDLMLVPAANAAEAMAAIASICTDDECVKVVPVRSVEDAVAALKLDDAGLDARLAQSIG